MTSTPSAVRQLVLGRCLGACERCYRDLTGPWGLSLHHRHPRGMGGTSNAGIHAPENLLALCGSGVTGCHGWAESNRRIAYEQGVLLRTGTHPEHTPYMDINGHWWLLTADTRLRIQLPFIHPQP